MMPIRHLPSMLLRHSHPGTRPYAILQLGSGDSPMKMVRMVKLIIRNSVLALSTIFGRVIRP
jgi:hypothetical protein